VDPHIDLDFWGAIRASTPVGSRAGRGAIRASTPAGPRAGRGRSAHRPRGTPWDPGAGPGWVRAADPLGAVDILVRSRITDPGRIAEAVESA
jgi:hypothetical protein